MAAAFPTTSFASPPSPSLYPSLPFPASSPSPPHPFLRRHRLNPSRPRRIPPGLSICLTPTQTATTPFSASERLSRLVSEFRSLPEPIDRVKRLLHYAAILPEFDNSARVDFNQVTGCTNQVWLDVRIIDPPSPRMRFRADSDSEITKGFCSCLIWVLDGAWPEEVLAVRSEDLGPMNMGVVAHSRVNTWHNVLLSMQRRTKGLLSSVDHRIHNGGGERNAGFPGNERHPGTQVR